MPYVTDNYIKRMKQALDQEGSSPRISRKSPYTQTYYLCKSDSRGKRCLTTKDGDKLVRPENTDAVKKYFVKKKKRKEAR